MTIREAADAIGVSVDTLRRWTDTERIRAHRTEGGHRRFPISEVQRVLSDRLGSPGGQRVRPLDPPTKPMRGLAGLLDEQGPALVDAACRRLYSKDARGWFASPMARLPLQAWLSSTATAARTGDYDGAVEAWQALARQAFIGGASLLECHSFLEFFGVTVAREVAAVRPNESSDCRRLLTSLRHWLLDGHSAAGGSATGPGGALGQPPSAQAPAGGFADGAVAEEGLDVPLCELLDSVLSLDAIDRGMVFVAEIGGLQLRLAADRGMRRGGASGARSAPALALGEGPIGRIGLERRARFVADVDLGDAPRGSGGAARREPALIVAPMLHNRRLIGVMCLGTRSSGPPDQSYVLLSQAFANEVAAALAETTAASQVERLERTAAAFRAGWTALGEGRGAAAPA